MQPSMLRYVSLADWITLLNTCFGFFAILLLFSGNVQFAFICILLALLADGLDGIVARKTKRGKLGDYLESMADMTSLCLAPMVFIYVSFTTRIQQDIFFHGVLLALFVLYLGCCLIRLGSFHIMKSDAYFVGLPASVSTIFLLLFVFLGQPLFVIMLLLFFVSIAMVSKIQFPKPGMKINGIASALIILTILLGNIFYSIVPLLLLIALLIYAIGGPLFLKKHFIQS